MAQKEINIGLQGTPVQINYEYCKGCGAQGLTCCKPHRFFTYEGWLMFLLNYYSGENDKSKLLSAAREADEDSFPGAWDAGEIGVCIVCRRRDCARPHRKYTREGYAKYQIEVMGIERSEAMKRANEEFRVFGGDWAWYPMNARGEFAPARPMSPNCKAPNPPPEGWPKVNDDKYVSIMRLIRAAWAEESQGKSQAELLRLRDEFDQRWCNMSGEEEPSFNMPWDDLPRQQAGDGSRKQYMESEGISADPGASHGGGYGGYSNAGNQSGAQSGTANAGAGTGFGGIPGMPNIFFSGSGGMPGFTFTHHQGNQSQTYEFPSGGGAPHPANQNQQTPPPPPQPTAPPKDASSQPSNKKAGTASGKAEGNPQDPQVKAFNESIQWYAKTFLEKTKGQSLETSRTWKDVLSKKFREEWGPYARTINMPWDEVPGIDDYAKPTFAENDQSSHTSFDEGFKKWKATNGSGNTSAAQSFDPYSSFDDNFKRWKESNKHGSTNDYKATDSFGGPSSSFDEGFRKWKDAQRHGRSQDSSKVFDGGYEKWKSRNPYDPENPFGKGSAKSGDAASESHANVTSNYDSDASIGPNTPRAPRGAGNEEYEDIRRHFEEMWREKSYGKRGSELRETRKVMEYSWLVRTGNDGKGEIMPWHSKYRKYVRRPSGSRSPAQPKEANMSWKYSTGASKTSYSPGPSTPNGSEQKGAERPYVYRSKAERGSDKLTKADRKFEEHKTKMCIEWDALRENSGNSPSELKKLAQIHQVKFERTTDDERAKTEVMPWTRYMQGDKPEPSTRPASPKSSPPKPDPPKTKPNDATKKPSKPAPKPGLPLFGMDAKYEKHKADYIREWESISKNSTSEVALKRLAQVHQVKFERTIEDERAKTEVMPWTKYIRGEDNGAREPPKPPKPTPPKDGSPKRQGSPKKPASNPSGAVDKYEKTKKEFSKDWERVRAARMTTGSNVPLKKLAQQHQVKFEKAIHDPRTKTDILPWTKYIHGDTAPRSDPFGIPEAKAAKPVPTTTGGDDSSYEKHKDTFVKEWQEFCNTTSSPVALRKQAQIQQVKFEGASKDDRAKTEIMPWTKYIGGKPNTETGKNPSSRAATPPRPTPFAPQPPTRTPATSAPAKSQSSAEADDLFKRHVARFRVEWIDLRESKRGTPSSELAKKIQRAFERKTADERAKTEVMPWTKWLNGAADTTETAPEQNPLAPPKVKEVPKPPDSKPAVVADEKYPRLKAECIKKWQEDSQTITAPAALTQLARIHQVKFEHWDDSGCAKTDEMPWTKHLRTQTASQKQVAEPPKAELPQSAPMKESSKPSKTSPKRPGPSPALSADEKYAKHKAAFVKEWQDVSARAKSSVALRKLAQTLQLKFKHGIEDDRAKTEVMPWSKHLQAKPNPKPDAALKPKTSKSRSPASDGKRPKPELPQVNTKAGESSSYQSFKRNISKQPTVETEPPSPERYSNPEATSQPPGSNRSSPTGSTRDLPPKTPASEEQKPQGQVSGIQYEMLKGRFEMDWDVQKEKYSKSEHSQAAKIIQTAFEAASKNVRSRTEVMPWTKYLESKPPAQIPVGESADAEQMKRESRRASMKPSTARPIADKQPSKAKPSSGDEQSPAKPTQPRAQKTQYQRQKEKFEMDWLLLQEGVTGKDFSRPALNIQLAFEEETRDERAKTEVMPWTQYLKQTEDETPPSPQSSVSSFVEEPAEPAVESPQPSIASNTSKYENVKARFEMTWDLQRERHDDEDYTILAKGIQKSFEDAAKDERAETEVMPWTEYLETEDDIQPVEPGPQEVDDDLVTQNTAQQYPVYPRAVLSSHQSQGNRKPSKRADDSVAKPNPAVDARFEKHKARFVCEWDNMCESRKGESRVGLAKRIQRTFEKRAPDERAKTEPMPWTKYLHQDGVVEQTVFKPLWSEPIHPGPIETETEHEPIIWRTPKPSQQPFQDHDQVSPRSSVAPSPPRGIGKSAEPSHAAKPPPQKPVQASRRSSQLTPYERHMGHFVMDWERFQADNPTRDVRKLAEKIQQKFERVAQDERARDEWMPWSKHLPHWHRRASASDHEESTPPNPERSGQPQATSKVQKEAAPKPRLSEQADRPEDYFEYAKAKIAEEWSRQFLLHDSGEHKELARLFQKGFEQKTKDPRAATMVMPWTVYLPGKKSKAEEKTTKAEKPGSTKKPERHTSTKKPTRQVSTKQKPKEEKRTSKPVKDAAKDKPKESNKPKPAAVPAPDAAGPSKDNVERAPDDENYEERKTRYMENWSVLREDKEGQALVDLARDMQRKFVKHSDNPGTAKDEVMPWQKYIPKSDKDSKVAKPSRHTSTRKHHAKDGKKDRHEKHVEKKKKKEEPVTNVIGRISDAEFRTHYDAQLAAFYPAMEGKTRIELDTLSTEYRQAWLDKVGVRAHEVRMPWDDILAMRKDRDEGADFDLLSVRVGKDGFEDVKKEAGTDEGMDWEKLWKGKKGWEREERKRKEEEKRRKEERARRRKKNEGCAHQ